MPRNQTHRCINCISLRTGWFHPRCGNAKSKLYNEDVKDKDTCSEFAPKHKASVPDEILTLEDIDDGKQ